MKTLNFCKRSLWIIALILLSISHLYAANFTIVHEDDNAIISLHNFAHYEYPNVLTIIRTTKKNSGESEIQGLYILCDEWKIATVDAKDLVKHKDDIELINHWPVEPFEFKKGTVGADLFLYFCSQLHRRSKWVKP